MISPLLALLTCLAADDSPVPPNLPPPPPMRAVRTETPPTIDGGLDDPAWYAARPYTHFVQRLPQELGAPGEVTEVRFLYDDTRLYIGARLYDAEPSQVVGRLGRRDQATGSDSFWVYIDSFHDRRGAYYFVIDAAGTKLDGTITNNTMDESNWDPTWDGVWEGAARKDEQGWTAELALPFSQLRYAAADAPVFGVDLRRDRSANAESDYVVFTPRKQAGFVSRFPELQGLAHIPPPHQVELLPYANLKAEMLPHSPGDPFNSRTRLLPNAGLDLKAGLASNLTLDATLNPDFGQAEVDPAVVNLTDVETYFDEKRPFFIEGASTFKFGNGGNGSNLNLNWSDPQLFYSRRIGRKPEGTLPAADYATEPEATRILGAVKLSGKVLDSLAIGTLHAVTNREVGEVETGGVRERVAVEPYSYFGVGRALWEHDEGRVGVGAIATLVARDLSDPGLATELARDALVLGLDGWAFLDDEREWVLMAWAAGSYVNGTSTYMTSLQEDPRHYLQRPDYHFARLDPGRTSLVGEAGRLRLEKTGGNVRLYAAMGAVDPRFECSDMGYLALTDVINTQVGTGYEWLNPSESVRDVLLLAVGGANFNFDRHLTWDAIFSLLGVSFMSSDYVEMLVGFRPNAVESSRRTRGGPVTRSPADGYHLEVDGQTDTHRTLVLFADAYVDASPASGTYHVNASLEVRPISSLSLSLGPTVEWYRDQAGWVGAFEDPAAAATYGSRYVFANLLQTTVSMDLRVNWTFTPTLSLQVFVQPFVSTGRYRHFKELMRPDSFAFNEYGRTQGNVSRGGGEVVVDPTGNGTSTFAFSDPEFSVKSLRGNAVMRWEYLPGSVLYAIWTQLRSRDDGGEPLTLGNTFRGMTREQPENVFMVKLSYWWSV